MFLAQEAFQAFVVDLRFGPGARVFCAGSMTHGLALPDAGGVIIVTSPSLTGAVPGDCADVRYRQWRRHNRNIRASLATSRYIDTTSRDIACRSQFDRWFFNACSTRWIARSGLAGTEHPFSGSQSMMALLRSF